MCMLSPASARLRVITVIFMLLLLSSCYLHVITVIFVLSARCHRYLHVIAADLPEEQGRGGEVLEAPADAEQRPQQGVGAGRADVTPPGGAGEGQFLRADRGGRSRRDRRVLGQEDLQDSRQRSVAVVFRPRPLGQTTKVSGRGV